MILLLIVALLPPLYLLRAVYRLDKIEKEPAGFIRSLVLWGVIAVIPAVILEMAAQYAFELMGINPLSTIGLLIDNFIGVALVEEGVKYFFLSRKTFKSPEFNFRFDGIVYAVAVSLGFAAAENIMYTFMYGLGASLFRAVTSIPGHAVFAIYMGHYYGTAKYMYEQGEVDASRSYRRLALWIPVLLHGFYDYTLSTQSTWMVLVFILYVVVLDVMWIWNDFLLPLLMVNSSNETKTLVLASYTFVGQMNTKWQYAMASMSLTVLPSIIVFIFLQRYIVEGVVAGAVKG